jgi:hypothetical protein
MSKSKKRFIAFSGPNIAQTWKEVVDSFRAPLGGQWTIYEITPLYAGCPEYLAELPDPDAPVIEVKRSSSGPGWVIWSGDYGWCCRSNGGWVFDGGSVYFEEYIANSTAALLRKHKDYPAGGAQ